MPVKNGLKRRRSHEGMTLVELMVTVAIVGILAAVAIPVFSNYAKESKMSEATTNIQGILEAEEAYFTRWFRYTSNLGICPPNPPAVFGTNQRWPVNVVAVCDTPAGSGLGWDMLGWKPDDAVYFQYRVFSIYTPAGLKTNPPPAGGWGINWAAEFVNNEPWCAVQAQADTDDDKATVFFRGNSYNTKVFRTPEDEF